MNLKLSSFIAQLVFGAATIPGAMSRYCNWGPAGTGASSDCDGKVQGGDWCNGGKGNCEAGCGGHWCTNDVGSIPSSTSPTTPTPPTGSIRGSTSSSGAKSVVENRNGYGNGYGNVYGNSYGAGYGTDVAKFPPRGNEFQVKRYGDIRSPCPAINTLANHGFYNRNGRDIFVEDLAQALEDVYRVSATTLMEGPIASAIEANLTESKNGRNVLTIDQLFQNRDSTTACNPNRIVGTESQEHDSSFVREDSDLPNYRTPSARLIHDFFEANNGKTLDPAEVMDYQRMRVRESCERHENGYPRTVRPYTDGQRGGMAIQGALLFVLGQSQRGPDFDSASSNLRTIVESETLPDGYDPDENVMLTFADGCDSDDLRDAFRANVNQAICDFCPADDAFPCDDLEEVPIITLPLGGTC